MMKLFFASLLIVIMLGQINAQVAINSDNSLPDNSAVLDVKSSSKGLLIPRMTEEQIRTITNPVNSLLVFCTTDNKFYAFMEGSNEWKEVLYGSGTLTPTCGTPVTDVRDGKTYNTIQIGTQCWMAQNLNLGIRIPNGISQSNNSIFEKFCYGDVESNCDVYGGLYQWQEMMQYTITPGVQGICPEDWHLPTDEEFTVLTTYLGGLDVAGGKMKEAGIAHWWSPNTAATNESGLTVLPGSYRGYLGGFGSLGDRAALWSSTKNTGAGYDCSYNYDMYYNDDAAVRAAGAMWVNGFSVRCVKD